MKMRAVPASRYSLMHAGHTNCHSNLKRPSMRLDYIVIYRPRKGRPVLHGRFDTAAEAAARCAAIQPKDEYLEFGNEIHFTGDAVVQRISGLRQTADGRRYLRKLGIDLRNL